MSTQNIIERLRIMITKELEDQEEFGWDGRQTYKILTALLAVIEKGE